MCPLLYHPVPTWGHHPGLHTALAVPQVGHQSDARGVPLPPLCAGYRIHYMGGQTGRRTRFWRLTRTLGRQQDVEESWVASRPAPVGRWPFKGCAA